MNIIGYEELYTIDNEGKVWSNKYNRYLKPYIKNGYYYIALSNNYHTKHYRLHRLIALHFIPNPENKPEIDHKDGNPLNNLIENLRWATRQEQGRNQKTPITNTTGYKGVIYDKELKKYRARITVDGQRIHLGRFDTAEEAFEEYNNKAQEIFGLFYRQN